MLSMENKKKDYKLEANKEVIDKYEEKVKEMENTIKQLENYQNSQNNKLLSSKLGKDDLVKKLAEVENSLEQKTRDM